VIWLPRFGIEPILVAGNNRSRAPCSPQGNKKVLFEVSIHDPQFWRFCEHQSTSSARMGRPILILYWCLTSHQQHDLVHVLRLTGFWSGGSGTIRLIYVGNVVHHLNASTAI